MRIADKPSMIGGWAAKIAWFWLGYCGAYWVFVTLFLDGLLNAPVWVKLPVALVLFAIAFWVDFLDDDNEDAPGADRSPSADSVRFSETD